MLRPCVSCSTFARIWSRQNTKGFVENNFESPCSLKNSPFLGYMANLPAFHGKNGSHHAPAMKFGLQVVCPSLRNAKLSDFDVGAISAKHGGPMKCPRKSAVLPGTSGIGSKPIVRSQLVYNLIACVSFNEYILRSLEFYFRLLRNTQSRRSDELLKIQYHFFRSTACVQWVFIFTA